MGVLTVPTAREPHQEKIAFQVKVFFPQIYFCGTGICPCFNRVCSQIPSAQAAAELSAAGLPPFVQITSEVLFILVALKGNPSRILMP